MADELDDEIRRNAEGPAKVAGDGVSVEQHKLGDQVEADRYADEMRDAKREILGIDGSPLEAYQERVRSLQDALRSGAISKREFNREMQSAKQDMLGVDPTPVQQYMQRIAELQAMLKSGAITVEQFRAEALEALPDKVKAIIDRTKSPLQKYREQLAELRQFRDLGLIDKSQFAMAAQELGRDVLKMPSLDDVASAFSSMGTFSAAAVFGVSAGGVNDRETKAAEATAQNTRQLVDHARRGRLVFGYESTGGGEAVGLAQICERAARFPKTPTKLPMSIRPQLRKWIRARQREATQRNTIAGGKVPSDGKGAGSVPQDVTGTVVGQQYLRWVPVSTRVDDLQAKAQRSDLSPVATGSRDSRRRSWRASRSQRASDPTATTAVTPNAG